MARYMASIKVGNMNSPGAAGVTGMFSFLRVRQHGDCLGKIDGTYSGSVKRAPSSRISSMILKTGWGKDEVQYFSDIVTSRTPEFVRW